MDAKEAAAWILKSLDADGLKKLCDKRALNYGRSNADRIERLAVAYRADVAGLVADLRVADLREAMRDLRFRTPQGELGLYGIWEATKDPLSAAARRIFVEGWQPTRIGDGPASGIATEPFYADDVEPSEGTSRDSLSGWDRDALEDEAGTGVGYLSCERIDPYTGDGPVGRSDAELADFQRAAIDAVDRHFRSAGARGLLCLPTGGGKTRTSLDWLLRKFAAKDQRILWVTHRIDLLNQVHEEVRGLAWLLRGTKQQLTVSRLQGPHDDKTGDIVLASAATLVSRRLGYADFSRDGRSLGVVCYDEAHRAVAKQTWKALARIIEGRNVPLLSLTATPFRTEKGGTNLIQQRLGSVVYSRTFKDLVDVGFLARPIFIRQMLNSTAGFRISDRELQQIEQQGDFTAGVLGRLARHPHRNEEIVRHWATKRDTYGKTLAFACDIEHAEALADMFRRAGARCDALHSQMEMGTRQRRLQAFRDGGLDVLVNVGILTEGANIPDTRTVLLARPTMSTSLYMQMIGRGSRGPRTVPGKNHFYVIDCVDNFQRHGLTMAGREVAAELQAEMAEQALPRVPLPPSVADQRRQRREAATASAWLRVRGFDPSQYSFWGELRWKVAKGADRSVGVFTEGMAALQQSLGLLRSAQQSGSWGPVHEQRRFLNDLGALRDVDWDAVVRDCRLTGQPPELVQVPELQITQEDDAAGTRLVELAAIMHQSGVPAGLAACDADWSSRPDLRERFATAAELRQEVIQFVSTLAAAAAQPPPPSTQAPAAPPSPWEPIEALVTLGMAMARADGVIHAAELNAVRRSVVRTFQLQTAEDEARAERLVSQAQAAPADVNVAAERLRDAMGWQARLVAFDWLFRVALADGRLAPEEIALLRTSAQILEIPADELDDRLQWYRDTDTQQVVSTMPGFITCSVCNSTWPGDSRFCGACGTALSSGSATAVARGGPPS